MSFRWGLYDCLIIQITTTTQALPHSFYAGNGNGFYFFNKFFSQVAICNMFINPFIWINPPDFSIMEKPLKQFV
jgi:hypothetical protein